MHLVLRAWRYQELMHQVRAAPLVQTTQLLQLSLATLHDHREPKLLRHERVRVALHVLVVFLLLLIRAQLILLACGK